MTDKAFNVLFLCTGNSARSILAEALVTIMSHGVLKGFSAGSHPRGQVHPIAEKLVLDLKYPKENLRSKSWNEYSHPNAPHMDFIITVCDNAKGEACPIWPGHPATLHWGLPDPALVSGPYEEQEKAFKEVREQLKEKIENLINIVRYMR
jgi:arsenate reductase